MNDFRNLMLRALNPSKYDPAPTLDSAAEDDDPSAMGGADFHERRIALNAAASVQTWAEDDSLSEGETYSDRLMALLVGIVDEDKNGELDDAEMEQFDIAREAAAQYLERLGVEQDDIEALLDEWDDDAAERVRDFVASQLPDGESAAEDMNEFVFGEEAEEPVFDKAFQAPKGAGQVSRGKNKAVYKTTVVVRRGVKTFARKRIAGKVRLTPAQKLSIKKARMLSHRGPANKLRARSMRLRKRWGVPNMRRPSGAK